MFRGVVCWSELLLFQTKVIECEASLRRKEGEGEGE